MINKTKNEITSNSKESERLNKRKYSQSIFNSIQTRLRKFPNIAKKEKLNYNIIKNNLSQSCNKANAQLFKDFLYEEKSNIKNFIKGIYTINTIEQNSLTEKTNSKLVSHDNFLKKINKNKNKSNNRFYKKTFGKKINKRQPGRQNVSLLSLLLFNRKNSKNKNSNSMSNSMTKNSNNIFTKKMTKKPIETLSNKIKIKNNKIIWSRNKNLALYNINNKNANHFFSANNSKRKIENKSNDFPNFKSLGEKYERYSEEKHSANNTNLNSNLTDDISKNMAKSINKYYEDSIKYNDFFNYNNHNIKNNEKTINNEKRKSKSKSRDGKKLKMLLSKEFKKYFTINKNNFFIKKNIRNNKSRNNYNYSLIKTQKTISNNLPLSYITNINIKDKIRNYTTFCSLNTTLSKCRSSYKNKLICKKEIYKIAMLKKKHDNVNKNKKKNMAANNPFLNVEKIKAKLPILKQKIFNVNIKLSKPNSIKKNKKNINGTQNKNRDNSNNTINHVTNIINVYK